VDAHARSVLGRAIDRPLRVRIARVGGATAARDFRCNHCRCRDGIYIAWRP
jgi:hypothetical protein